MVRQNSFAQLHLSLPQVLADLAHQSQRDVSSSELDALTKRIANVSSTSKPTQELVRSTLTTICTIESGFPAAPRYYAASPRSASSDTYHGVCQLSRPYWADAREYIMRSGVSNVLVPPRDVREATVAQQLTAVLAYAMRYRNRISAPLTVAGWYVVHNQGYSVDTTKTPKSMKKQSVLAQEQFALARSPSFDRLALN